MNYLFMNENKNPNGNIAMPTKKEIYDAVLRKASALGIEDNYKNKWVGTNKEYWFNEYARISTYSNTDIYKEIVKVANQKGITINKTSLLKLVRKSKNEATNDENLNKLKAELLKLKSVSKPIKKGIKRNELIDRIKALIADGLKSSLARNKATNPQLIKELERLEETKKAELLKKQKEEFAKGTKRKAKYIKNKKTEKSANWEKTIYTFEIDGLPLIEDNLGKVERTLTELIEEVPELDVSQRAQFIMKTDGDYTSTKFNSEFNNIYMAKNKLMKSVEDYIRNKYDNSVDYNIIEEFQIVVLNPVGTTLGSCSRSSVQAHEQWLIITPKSDFNCAYQAVAVCRNFQNDRTLLEMTEEGQSARVVAGKNLKAQLENARDNYADDGTLQQLADYTRMPIKLFNNVFEEIKQFAPVNPLKRYKHFVKCYELQRVGNHCIALIRKKNVLTAYKEYNFEKLIELGSEVREECLIERPLNFDNFPSKLCVLDIETSNNALGQHIPYAVSIAWAEYKVRELTTSEIDEIATERIRVNNEVRSWKKWLKVDEAKREKLIKATIERRCVMPKVIRERHIEFKEHQIWGLNCLSKITEFIYANEEIFSGSTIYAHNGGKYDLPLLIDKSFLSSDEFSIVGDKCVELNNSWIGFTMEANNNRKFTFSFRDSFRMLPAGLEKLSYEFEVKYRKLTETVRHDEITLENFNTFPQLKTYLTHDVFGLLEIVRTFAFNVFEELGIDLTKCLTGASLSKRNFFKNYYNPQKNPVYTLSKGTDEYIRNSYFGGRVECFQMGKIEGKAYYYDFTSEYPDVGCKLLPYGKPNFVELNGVSKLDKTWFGWTRCMAKTIDRDRIPIHACIKDSRLIFPILDNWTEITIFSAEIDYDVYEYKFIDGYEFQSGHFMRRFFKDCFTKKANAKEQGNNAMSNAYKIIMNSGYGFWGLRTEGRDGIIIGTNHLEYAEYLNSNKLKGIREVNGYTLCRVMKDLDIKTFNVAVAAAISSYARLKLLEVLQAIRNVGGKIFYCDTDSIICNINLNDFPDLKKKFQWDGNGEELGSLKNEADEIIMGTIKSSSIKKIIDENETLKHMSNAERNYQANKLYKNSIYKKEDKKIYDDLRASEGGNFHFDACIITGCKQYALNKKFVAEGKDINCEIAKLKGFSGASGGKITFKKIESLTMGEKITQCQKQFRCPKSNYISETSSFHINTKSVNKNFRMVYTKGVIHKDMTITPLLI